MKRIFIFFIFNLIVLLYFNFNIKYKDIVAVILPITSKGNNINRNDPDPSQLYIMKYFYPSFLLTIEPQKYNYKVYIGYFYDDYYLSNIKFLMKLKKKLHKNLFKVLL